MRGQDSAVGTCGGQASPKGPGTFQRFSDSLSDPQKVREESLQGDRPGPHEHCSLMGFSCGLLTQEVKGEMGDFSGGGRGVGSSLEEA